MTKIAQLCATFGRVGYLPASGTIATAIVFIVAYVTRLYLPLSGWTILIAVVLLTLATYFYSRISSQLDPKEVVSDEAIASLVLIWLIPHALLYYTLTFIFFRFFDIKKPLGIKRLENLPGVYGIISDDLLAGLYTLVLIRLIQFVS